MILLTSGHSYLLVKLLLTAASFNLSKILPLNVEINVEAKHLDAHFCRMPSSFILRLHKDVAWKDMQPSVPSLDIP